jgi:prophage regulatory protein
MTTDTSTPARPRRAPSAAVSVEPLIVDLPTAAAVVALSTATLQRLVQQGQFPQPRKLSEARVGWRMADLRQWSDGLPASDLLPPARGGD